MASRPTFFATRAAWRAWLERHHASAEVLVGFYKRATARPGITWPESVDEALCFGWIDGIRRSIDAASDTIRFTPRKPRSIWSGVNTRRMQVLIAQGRVHASGLAAFAARDEDRSGTYSYEQRRAAVFDADDDRRFRANGAAWAFFSAQRPGIDAPRHSGS